MAKKVVDKLRLHIPGGAANPAPPIGPALGQRGINIALFCKEFNAKTRDLQGYTIPVEITVYEDRSFTFVVKEPLTSDLLKKAAGVEKGSGVPNREKVGKITRAQLEEIAKRKLPDLYAKDMEGAIRTIMGTARSMGIEIVE